MPILFPRFQMIGVALATFALGQLANPGQAQLPIPVEGKRAFIQPSGRFNFQDLVAWERTHPPMFQEPIAIPAPLSIEGRLTELDTAPVKTESGDEEDSDHDPYSPSPVVSFVGLVDNQTSFPPDTQGAVGPNHVMTILNTQVQIQNKSGTIKYGPVSLTAFCGSALASGNTAFDPHVTYDAATGHWIVVLDAAKFSNDSNSRLLIFISKTNDPTGSWFHYSILTDPGANFSDYPALGISNNWITVTVNKFAVTNGKSGGFVKATIFAFNRAEMEAAQTTSQFSWDDTSGFTVSPTVTYDAGINTQYMVQDDSGNARLRICTISGTTTHPVYVSGASFATTSLGKWGGGGNIAPESGVSDKVDTGDSRILNAVYRNGYIWCAQTIALPASKPTRTAVQWWQFSPTGTVHQVGRIDDSTAKVFRAYPSIGVNSASDVLIGYSRFSSSIHPSAYYTLHKHTDASGTVEAEVDMKAGEAPYAKYGASDPRNRWGDYSATVVDPTDNLSFWTVQEYSKSPSNTWSTWWAHVPNH